MKRREFLRGLLALPVVGVGAVVLGCCVVPSRWLAKKEPMRGGRVGASEFHARGRYDYDAGAYTYAPLHSPQNFRAYLPSAELLEQMWAVQMKREADGVLRGWEEYSRCK